MKTFNTMKFITALCLCMAVLLAACEVEQTEEGAMPDVDVAVEAGEMPEYDVDWANVDVGTTTQTVEVPKVVVTTETEQVEVPYLDVNMPEGGEKEEQTIMVEAEVNEEADLRIQEVYATGNRLVVIARLESMGQPLDGETVRVSDRVVLNAPDLEVERYIVGTQPTGDFNDQYTYVEGRSAIPGLENGQTIYSR
jgi:hypothetical protein